MKQKTKIKLAIYFSLILITSFALVQVLPVKEIASAVKYSLDSSDTITDIDAPSFTGTMQVGKSGTAGYVYIYPTDTAGGTNEGTVYMDDSENLLKYYNGSGWITVGVDYSEQASVSYDDYESGDYEGEESTWTIEVASEVWQDQRTGLYWTKDLTTASNIFPDQDHSACPFFDGDLTDRTGYDGLDADCGAAINYCGALSKNDGGGAKTDWYLPSQKELMQAYINGIYNQADADPSYFWSSTEISSDPTSAWYVNLDSGYTNGSVKTNDGNSVRCVRRD